jgi:hypothetical protein
LQTAFHTLDEEIKMTSRRVAWIHPAGKSHDGNPMEANGS